MLIPIQTARSAAASAEDASAKAPQTVAQLPASQRGEAIQKILDALTRHLSGREILSKDALVRLMEDLARILKFPPLPQEGGREFVRRLVAFLESMPASDRLLLERQLGGRSLSIRVGLLAELPAIRNGTSIPRATATPMPAQARDVILRNPSLQPALPFNPSATRGPVASEVALLQAVLRKTFGVGNDTLDLQRDDLEQTSTTEPQSTGRSEKPAERREVRADARTAASSEGASVESAAALLGGEGEVEEVASLATAVAEADEKAQHIDTGHGGEAVPPSDDSAALAIEGQAASEMEQPETTGDPNPDGTYGPLPDADGENDRKTALSSGRGDQDARPSRVLSDAIKTLIRDSVALPGGALDAEPGAVAQQADETSAPPQVPAKDTGPAAREAGAAIRQREVSEGGSALSSLINEPTEEANANQRTALETRPQRPVDEQTIQQMIARLVENGLPREAIPFTMIPYPATGNDVEHFEDVAHERPGSSDEEPSGEEQEDAEGNQAEEGDTDQHSDADDETPEAPDAYDLYRKLGDLG